MTSLGGAALKQRHPTSLRNESPPRTPHDLDTLSPPPLPANANTNTNNRHHPYQQLTIDSNGKNPKTTTKTTTRTSKDHFQYPRSTFGACALYLGFLFSLAILAFQLHYSLPTPVSSANGALIVDPLTGQKQFSEENVRRVVRHLSEDIGYRIVGTEQDQETQRYLLSEIQALKVQAEKESARRSSTIASEENGVVPAAFPKFEVWTQKDDGAHQFDFMSKGMFARLFSHSLRIITRQRHGICQPIVRNQTQWAMDKSFTRSYRHRITCLFSPLARQTRSEKKGKIPWARAQTDLSFLISSRY